MNHLSTAHLREFSASGLEGAEAAASAIQDNGGPVGSDEAIGSSQGSDDTGGEQQPSSLLPSVREVAMLLARFACNNHTICDEELRPVSACRCDMVFHAWDEAIVTRRFPCTSATCRHAARHCLTGCYMRLQANQDLLTVVSPPPSPLPPLRSVSACTLWGPCSTTAVNPTACRASGRAGASSSGGCQAGGRPKLKLLPRVRV